MKKQKAKQTISCILGFMAAFIAFSEPEIEYWYIPFLAMGALLAILKWNNLINLKER